MSERSVVDQIKHYQRDITKCPDNAKRMIRCIERLMVLPVTIAHLQETGVGRSVNELRKCGGEVGAAANALVCKWKSMVQAEESDGDSEVEEDEHKDSLQVSSPDIRNSPPPKTEAVDKYKKISNNEDCRKPKSDIGSKKSESSHSENRSRSSDHKSSDRHDHKSHQSRSSKSGYSSGSDSKHSLSHKSKSEHHSKSTKKSHTSHRSESECNGDIKTEKRSSKTKHEESKSSKSNSSESKNKDIKQKYDKEKHRREDSSHKSDKENRRKEESSHRSVGSSDSKKYDVRRIESESSDDEKVYKPRSKKRKKSESEEDRKHHSDKYNARSKHRESKRHDSSEESDVRNGSEDEESSRPSSRHAGSQIDSDNEEEISNRSSPNNMSDNEVESDNVSGRSSSRDDENEGSQSEKASDSEENDESPEREIYVPTKIKKEKESPPRYSKSLSSKSESSHPRSSHSSTHKSSNHRAVHNSSNHSKSDKTPDIKKEDRLENVKIKKEKDENQEEKKRREEKSSDKKNYKSSNTHSDSSSKQSNKTEKIVKIKIEKEDDGSIDCVSGASFADALMGLSEPKKKSVKRKSTTSSPEKSSKPLEKPADGKSKSHSKAGPQTFSSSSSSSTKTNFKEPDLLSKNIKLEPLDVDLKATLPEITPHYKPLPHYSPPGSPPGKRTKLLSQEEALSTIMSTKNQRTKVYSGNKSGYLKVPSLFDLCIQVLRDNIEALEYTGGVPYDLLKPVLDRATAAQLFQLEHYNPYLVEDTDGLWKFHCNKDFRGKEPDEFETWRELYVRLLDERERKLEALKANITQSMAKNTPVRQTKLAYVDSVVKPPRNIAKKQMKFGTGKAVKHDLISKAMVGAASSAPAPAAVPVPAPSASARSSHSSNAFPIPGFLKKKKAPLMQKTLQLIKGNRFKR